MATITITYAAPAALADGSATQQIFSVWNPAATASDNEKFEGTYYQTNVWDKGEFAPIETIEKFFMDQVAHPGLIAALRAAMRAEDKSYAWDATADDVLYVEEISGALADQGFTFVVGEGSGEG